MVELIVLLIMPMVLAGWGGCNGGDGGVTAVDSEGGVSLCEQFFI